MKINLTTVLNNLEGTPLKGEDNQNLTVGVFLGIFIVEPKTQIGWNALKRYTVATKCVADKEIELDEADLKTLKDSLENSTDFSPLVTGQVYKMLDK